jgi:mono/diheme cytochrome c family protein
MPSEYCKQELGASGNVRHWSAWRLAGLLSFFGLSILVVTACASPQVSALSPTPIPTLMPATMVPSQIEPAETERLVIESFPAGIPAAAAGQALYAEHCVECHGEDGNGQVPNARNFSDVDYMRGETPLDFYVAITEGEASFEDAENEMPAFGDVLTSDERWDLVYYVWRFATSGGRLSTGGEIYTAFCEECHGNDGRSQILDAADLSDQRFMAAQSPSTLYLSVTRGRGSMPAWQARLNQDERWMVIEYLRTFSYDPQVMVESEEIPVVEEPVQEEEQSPCEPAVLAQTNPFEWSDAQAIAAGQTIYQRECSECHGEDGSGEIPQARDFTNPAVRARLLENPGEHLCVVTEGFNRMPDFKDTLSEEEMWQVLTFIAALGE